MREAESTPGLELCQFAFPELLGGFSAGRRRFYWSEELLWCKPLLVIAVAYFALSSCLAFDFVFGAFPGRRFLFHLCLNVPIFSVMASGIGVMI